MDEITLSKTFSGITVKMMLEIKKIANEKFNGNESPTVCKLLAEALEARKNKVLAEVK